MGRPGLRGLACWGGGGGGSGLCLSGGRFGPRGYEGGGGGSSLESGCLGTTGAGNFFIICISVDKISFGFCSGELLLIPGGLWMGAVNSPHPTQLSPHPTPPMPATHVPCPYPMRPREVIFFRPNISNEMQIGYGMILLALKDHGFPPHQRLRWCCLRKVVRQHRVVGPSIWHCRVLGCGQCEARVGFVSLAYYIRGQLRG